MTKFIDAIFFLVFIACVGAIMWAILTHPSDICNDTQSRYLTANQLKACGL